MIGEQIKKFRLQKGITQEELGKLVGVTTQAVSKWERGGVPDAEILPHIADALGIKIDMLFGRQEIQSLEEMVTDKILSLNREDGFRQVFSLICAMCMGLTGLTSIKEGFSMESLDKLKDDDGYHYYARASLDEGTINAKMDTDFRYFFVMPEPPTGYAAYFRDIEELTETFRIFADKDVLNVICLSRPLLSSQPQGSRL